MRASLNIPEGHPLREFRTFAGLVWRHLGLPKMTKLQLDICDWLQHGGKRIQVQAFRGAGKSYLTSAFCLWLLLMNPEEKILVISASQDRAMQFVLFTKRLIHEMSLLSELRPDTRRGDRDSATALDVGCCVPAQSPSLRAAGITGQITGSRASTIILDDVEIPTNSATPAQREKLSASIREIDAIILPEAPALGIFPKIRVLGTPQTFQSVYTLLRESGYEPRIWPVQTPTEQELIGYGDFLGDCVKEMLLRGDPPGTPTEPTRFTPVDIQERRLAFGSAGFALQFMLSTQLSDAARYPLKIKDLIFASFPTDRAREIYVHSNHPQYKIKELDNPGLAGDGFFRAAEEIGAWTKFDRTVVAVDPSGRGNNETAIISGSLLSGMAFVHRVIGLVDGFSEETLEAIAKEAARVKAHRIVVEENYGGGMFTQLLRPVLRRIYPCDIHEVKQKRQKETRIVETLQPVFEAHRLVFHDSIPQMDRVMREDEGLEAWSNKQLFRQAAFLTIEKDCLPLDDRIDCLALLVQSFADAMSLDSRQQKRERDEEDRDVQKPFEIETHFTVPSWTDYSNPFRQ